MLGCAQASTLDCLSAPVIVKRIPQAGWPLGGAANEPLAAKESRAIGESARE